MDDEFRTQAALGRLAATHCLDGEQTAALSAYVELLLGWRRANVTGLTDPVAVVDTLIGDSLALLAVPQLRERETGSWLDLGAGAGIPGIPLAVALPSATVTLLDAVAKKCTFLEAAIAAAGLAGRARVVCARSERYASAGAPGREAYAVVLARAVSGLPVLVELAAPSWRTAACCSRARRGAPSRRRAAPRPRQESAAGSRPSRRCRFRHHRSMRRSAPSSGRGSRPPTAPSARRGGRQATAERVTGPSSRRRRGSRAVAAGVMAASWTAGHLC